MKTTFGLLTTKCDLLPVLFLALLGAGLAGVASGQVVNEFPVPTASSGPEGITAGPDGNLWFTEDPGSKIARITPNGAVTEFPTSRADSYPPNITSGPDGNLWFTELGPEGNGFKIGRIDTAGVISEFPVSAGQLYAITSGPDCNVWFTAGFAPENFIGQITPAGLVTLFVIPTADSGPVSITAGPDGDLWFAEGAANQIGRITTAGVITEFPITTADSTPNGITAGPDGNLWFTEFYGNQIGRITAAGNITEFPIPTSISRPGSIAAGPDGNLWFTESNANQIGRVTTAGVVSEFPIPTANSGLFGIAAGPDGNLWFTESSGNKIGRITTGPTVARPMAIDAHAVTGSNSDANGVLEPGETVQVAPSWNNTLADPQSFTGTASNLAGPTGPTYTLVDGAADYGSVNGGATSDCNGTTGDCYLMTVSGARPAAHWDATFTENLSSNSITKNWTLHVGDSFPDVPRSNQFYGFIENLFHNAITGGCGGGNYCPDGFVTRSQMAVFLMRARLGANHVPPPATGTVFNDVPLGAFAGDYIEELARYQITGGCGGGNYCPDSPVTRAQMAAFLLKSEHGSDYTPPDCTGVFGDVACPSQFANWIEQLAAEGITGGCGSGNYCPGSSVSRGQMAVFLVKTFGLQLYGPNAPRLGPSNPYHVGVLHLVVGNTSKYLYLPSPIHIHVGDTIIWSLDGIHSSTGPDWDSGVGPSSFAHTFTEAGTFAYHCSANHGAATHNPGTVVVDP